MDKKIRTQEYLQIRNLRDLHHHQRILASKIDNQEIMIKYKLRTIWSNLSPSSLINMGCSAIAAHNSSFNVFYKTFLYFKNFFKRQN